MYSLKISALLLIALPFLLAISVDGKGSKGSKGGKGGSWVPSTSTSNFWFYAYSFSSANWPKTKGSMWQFGNDAAEVMWTNRPDKAQAAICVNGPWDTKNVNQTGAVVRTSYFKDGLTKKVRM